MPDIINVVAFEDGTFGVRRQRKGILGLSPTYEFNWTGVPEHWSTLENETGYVLSCCRFKTKKCAVDRMNKLTDHGRPVDILDIE